MILGPVQGSLFLPSIAHACPAGQVMASTGRCQVTTETLNDNNAATNCNGDQTCLENNAKAKSEVTGESPFSNDEGEAIWGKNGSGSVASAVAIGIPLLIVGSVLLTHSKRKKAGSDNRCRPASLLLMYAAAAALAVGEIYGFFHHKAKLDEIQAKWDKDVVKKETTSVDKKKTNATEAQSQAFEYLAQNEDQVANTAKTKKGFYIAATSLFAAGAIAATVEQVQLGIAKSKLKAMLPGVSPAAPDLATREQARQKIARLTCSTDDDLKGKNFKTSYDEEGNVISEAPKQPVLIEPKPEPDPELLAPAVTGPINNGVEINLPEGSGGSNWQWTPQNPQNPQNPQRFESPIKGSATDPHFAKYLPEREIEKMKQVAAYNISTAKDAEQLLQLVNELNAIELENYTKITYLEEDQAKDLKKVPLISEVTKHLSEAFMSSAYAEETACSATDAAAAAEADAAAEAAEPEKEDTLGKVIGIAGTALPLVLGLKSIMGGVKSQGGVPLAEGVMDSKVQQSGGWIMKAIGKPYTRIAINGVLGIWMGFMAAHMQKVKEDSEARAIKLREMKEEFVSANGLLSCKEEDRKNSCKPICYCYTPDNKRNPDRAKDKVCANTYANMKYEPFGNEQNDRICLDQGSRIDPTCACRAKKSCMKITSRLNMSGFKPGTFKMISAGSGPAQDLFNGNVGAGNISDSAGINAAKIRNAASDLLKKTDPKAAKASNKFAAELAKGLLAIGSGMSMGGGNRSALPSSPSSAAAALDKELKDHKKEKASATSNPGVVGAGFSGDEEEPDVTMAEDGGDDIEIAEVMGKEMDLGDSDVNKGSHTNIFEVLSNRYQRSGMRRLFDPNSAAPADAPSKNELAD